MLPIHYCRSVTWTFVLVSDHESQYKDNLTIDRTKREIIKEVFSMCAIREIAGELLWIPGKVSVVKLNTLTEAELFKVVFQLYFPVGGEVYGEDIEISSHRILSIRDLWDGLAELSGESLQRLQYKLIDFGHKIGLNISAVHYYIPPLIKGDLPPEVYTEERIEDEKKAKYLARLKEDFGIIYSRVNG